MNDTRCKACGLTFSSAKDYEICPACGVDKKAFEEYKETVSEKRKKLLDLHLHPVLVHFPQALVVLVFLFSIIDIFYSGSFSQYIQMSIPALIVLLVLSTPAAIAAGIFDAKLRFKRLDTPFIKIKILSGLLFLLFTIGIVLSRYFSLGSVPVIILCFCAMICQFVLGQVGVRLMYAVLPGD